MQKKTTLQILYFIFLLFILFDLGYSFSQYAGGDLDGDFAESVVPKPYIEPLLKDPLGIKTVLHQENHFASNRFFSHWIFLKTFHSLPFFFQIFTDPINSVYLSCASVKLIMHFVLLILICVATTGSFKIFSKEFIIALVITTPFFQANGSVRTIGLIDPSTTYSFFYAMPLIFLAIYFMPLFLDKFHNKKIKMGWPFVIVWGILAFLVCLSGPLNPGIALICSLILFVHQFGKNFLSFKGIKFFSRIWKSIRSIPKNYFYYLLPISFLSLYSLYLGSFNDAWSGSNMPLPYLYSLLPKGILSLFTRTPWILLISIITINYAIIYLKYKEHPAKKQLFSLLKFVGLFTLLYILLLPLGGYREYRPLILRYDTIIPITFLTFILVGTSSLFLLRNLRSSKRIIYSIPVISLLLFFTINDKRIVYNTCEKESIAYIASSPNDIVELDNDCAVINWNPHYTPEESYYFGELLYLWRITDRPKLYYNRPPNTPE